MEALQGEITVLTLATRSRSWKTAVCI